MRMQSRISNERGLTMVELMISLFVMVTTVGMAVYLLSSAQQLSRDSRERLMALNAARSTLEAVKDTPLGNVTGINAAAFVPAELSGGQITILTNPANLTGATIATVTVRVAWNGTRNIPRTLQVSTRRSVY